MRRDKPPMASSALTAILAVLLSACSVNVSKESNGHDKQVDIKTLLGGIRVSEQADVADTGLPVYPGARPKNQDRSGSDKSANVNISGFGYGVKVAAVEYVSEEAPVKILAFYRNELAKFGTVLECKTSKANWTVNMGHKNSNELTCNGTQGEESELKVGRRDDQHIVAVQPEGKGTSFSLVYVRTHGKGAEI